MLGKKSYILLGSLISSTLVYAHAPIPTQASYVYIPNFEPGFQFMLAPIALKPGASNLNYIIYNNELPAQTPGWTEKEIQPGYHFAFMLGGRYFFQPGADINLDWTHLNSTSTASVATPNANFFLGPDYEIGPAGLTIRNGTGNAQFKYDVINLDAAQYVNFGHYVQVRFFGGLSTAFLREQVNATYSGNVVTGAFQGPFSTMQSVTANFTGAGPRFGVETNFITDSGFGIFGEAAASALIGESYSKTNYTSSSQELFAIYGQTLNNQYIKDQNVTQVIPGFDAKLGLSYRRRIHQQGPLLTLKGGYQTAVYVNAISQYTPGTLVTPLQTGGIFVATMNHTLSNYSVQGPFVEADLKF